MEVLLKMYSIHMESPPWSSEQKAEEQHSVPGPLLEAAWIGVGATLVKAAGVTISIQSSPAGLSL